jgi:light-regulated signal transduction histidine kinase (bacteriophytochrome)
MEKTINFNEFYGGGLAREMTEEELLEMKEEEEKQKFRITDLGSADWVLRKRQEVIDRLEQETEYARVEIQKYQNFISNQERAAEEQIAYFNCLLEEYLREKKELDQKYKLVTAIGQANFRNSATWRYEEDEVMDYLKENKMDEFIRVKVTESINKVDLKKSLKVFDGKAVTDDGEIIPGITVEQTQTLTIKME